MSRQLVSKTKANQLALGLLFIGLGIIAYIDNWWPSILLALGLSLALRQFFLGKLYDSLLVAAVFVGTFLSFQFDWPFLPVLFFVAGIYLFFRDASNADDQEEEVEDETQKEMEEHLKD